MTDQAQNLRDMMRQRRGNARYVTVTGAAGVGKSLIAHNLAAALGQRGREARVMDMGAEGAMERGLPACLVEAPPGMLCRGGNVSCWSPAYAGEGRPLSMEEGLLRLEEGADILILDAPAQPREEIRRLMRASDETLVVIRPQAEALLAGYALMKMGAREGARIMAVVNGSGPGDDAPALLSGVEEILLGQTGCRLWGLGAIPRGTWGGWDKPPAILQQPGSPLARSLERMAQTYEQAFQGPGRGAAQFLRAYRGGAGEAGP